MFAQDGEAWNAAAAKLNFDHILGGATRSRAGFHDWYGLGGAIESWNVMDAMTFEVTFFHFYEPALRELSVIRPFRMSSPKALPSIAQGYLSCIDFKKNAPRIHGVKGWDYPNNPIPGKDRLTCNGVKAPIGTGPYKVISKVIKSEDSLRAVKVGQAFLINGDDPAGQASGSNTGWALVSHGIGEKLYSINDAGVLVTQLASAMPVKSSDGSWIVILAAGRKFSDGTPVTASDVKTALSRTNQFNGAAKTVGTMTFEAQGDLTLKITTQNPTPVLANILSEWWAVVYKTVNTASSCTSLPAVGVRDPVPICRIFTGPYEIKRLKTTTTSSGTTGNELDMIPNAFHPGACLMLHHTQTHALSVSLSHTHATQAPTQNSVYQSQSRSLRAELMLPLLWRVARLTWALISRTPRC